MENGTLIAERYRVEGALGSGGMAAVYRVVDERSGARVALKRMPPPTDPTHVQKLRALFEREFYGLSQLKHPNIIEVFDCGLDGDLPYYTMEMLDGQDLRELTQVDWKHACKLMRDVCSALAMLHSRRFVHRDISPRNVRCTSDGRAKLIDFGAMVPMGQAAHILGTPPFMAPEIVSGQMLDGRTDLFAVGALLYWALTGTHAYPARAISQLRDLWRSAPPLPSTRNPEIPDALDQLVMSLIALDPMARPVNASVVIHRLCAIADLEAEAQAEVANAYLVTPTLVGRSEVQLQFRKRMLRVLQGHGGALMLEGEAGMGRSRVLASIALEAKLLGAIVLRVNAATCRDQEKTVLSALVDELLEAAPEHAITAAKPFAPTLGIALPNLHARIPDAAPIATISNVIERNAQLQQAVVEWLSQLSGTRVLTIFVDDVHRCDSTSASLLAQLAQVGDSRRLFVVTTQLRDAQALAPRALALLRERGSRETLKALQRSDVDELLRSMFGDTPGLQVVGEWIHRLGQGSPRASMQLAQHLVDRGVATYADGNWTLPETLRDLDLPQSFAQALEARMAALSPAAREIVAGIALVVSVGSISIADLVQLFGEHMELETIYAALEELSSASIINYSEDIVEIREAATKQAALRNCSSEQLAELHARLARVYAAGDAARRVMAVHHLHAAGDYDSAYTQLGQALTREGSPFFDVTPVRSSHGLPLVEWALRHAKSRAASPSELHRWRRALVQLAAAIDARLCAPYADETLAQLRKDTGLVHFDELDATLDVQTRLHMCFARAQETYAQAADNERGLELMVALRELALAAVLLSGAYSLTWNCTGLQELEALILPLRGLAPALDLLYRTLAITVETIVMGNSVRDLRRELMTLLETPMEGFDEQTRIGTRLIHNFYLSMEEAQIGDPGAPGRADELIAIPALAPLGWHARMIYHLGRGEAAEANACRQQRELLVMGDDTDHHLTGGMLGEAILYASLGDLLGVARLLPHFERLAIQHEGWRPWTCYVRALYRSLRGETSTAQREVEDGLAGIRVGEHNAWFALMALYISMLAQRGDAARALDLAKETYAQVEQKRLRLASPGGFALAVILAHAQHGDAVTARELAEHHLATEIEKGTTPVLKGQLHEACAQLALLCGDRPAALRHLQCVAEIYKPGQHPGLIARYERLLAQIGVDSDVAERPVSILPPRDGVVVASTMATTARSWLISLRDEQQRAQEALDLLIKSCHATGGYLYSVSSMKDALLIASQAQSEPEPGMSRWVAELAQELIGSWSTQETMTVSTGFADSLPSEGAAAGYLQRFALGNAQDGVYKLAAIVVLCSRDGSPLRVPGDLLRSIADALSATAAEPHTVAALAGG